MNELRIFGPPGTGKSTRLATEEIPNAVKKYGSDRVVVTSFTRTGAKEIACKRSIKTDKTIPVQFNHVGTLHALCYRLLDQPPLVNKDHIVQWNETYPKMSLSPGLFKKHNEGITESNNINSAFDGDVLFNTMDICRAKMIDKRYWTPKVMKMEQLWKDFKDQLHVSDFTDLIETCIDKFPYAPGRPDVIFVDEAQDFTRLQLSLVRSWGEQSQWIVLCGDDDQCIFSFAGATPEVFTNPPIDEKYKRILDQSYRVPEQILKLSQRIIRQVSVREEKEYSPRKKDGEIVKGIVREIDEGYSKPEKILTDIQRQIMQNKSVMVLATCSYMIDPIKHELKNRGMLFGNQYRKERGDWNPLRTGDENINTAKDIVLNFLSRGNDGQYWDIKQFVSWAQNIKVQENGLIYKNGKAGIKALKKALKNGHEGLHTSRNVLKQILTPKAVDCALNRDLNWLLSNTLQNKQSGLEYPIKVYNKFGLDVLKEKPKITIGTIHSVKGGESSVVYLYPDISYVTKKQLDDNYLCRQTKDDLYRLFYVGMTRAKEELVIMKYSRQKGRVYYVNLYGAAK